MFAISAKFEYFQNKKHISFEKFGNLLFIYPFQIQKWAINSSTLMKRIPAVLFVDAISLLGMELCESQRFCAM